MTTILVFHETENGEHWARAWHKGPGSRHEMFETIGAKCRNFRDPNNPDSTGVMLEIPDLKAFENFLALDETKKAMAEDGLKVDTLRVLTEFIP
jgi:hypothetical protein